MKFRIVLHALFGVAPQLINEQRMCIGPFCVFRLGHFVIGQRILKRAFAELRKITQARQDNIGGHAMELRGAACDPIKFLDRQLQCAIFIGMASQERSEPADWQDCLHGAFTKCTFVTDDHRSTIVLECSRKNLASGRALPAAQNYERTSIRDAVVGIRRNSNITIVIFRLNDRARLQKQAGKREGFFQ